MPKTSSSPRRSSGRAVRDPGTRQLLIEAAIQTILEHGFYRASSNAMAEKAGVTWGVIQYYFGSRENLMLAVLEEGTRRLVEVLANADITGETLTERFEQYFRILNGYYGKPEYLAFIQVRINLSRDPRTSDQARQTMVETTDAVEREVSRLTRRLFAGTAIRSRSLRRFPFRVLQGLALSETMSWSLTPEGGTIDCDAKDAADEHRYLAQALALLIEHEATASD